MGQKVPGTPRKYRPSLKNSPLKFQKKQHPEKIPLQNSPVPLKIREGGGGGGSYPDRL